MNRTQDSEDFSEEIAKEILNENDDSNKIFSIEIIKNKNDIDELKQDLIKLKQQLEEEKSNSKQAAEYGLSLLEDFKKLQSKNYELEGEIETVKADLESTNLVILNNLIFFRCWS